MIQIQIQLMNLIQVAMNFSIKYIIFYLISILLVCIYNSNYQEFNLKIKYCLDSQLFSVLLFSLPLLTFIVHFIRNPETDINENHFITKRFGTFFDHFSAALSIATAILTSGTILKRIFIQNYIGTPVYFNEFGSIDKITLSLVMSFLFYTQSKIVWTVFIKSIKPDAEVKKTL